MARFSASRSPEVSGRETRNMERSRKIASQGMVLLRNRFRGREQPLGDQRGAGVGGSRIHCGYQGMAGSVR